MAKRQQSVGEYAAYLLAGGLILFLYLSAFGVFTNFYSKACAAAKPHGLWVGLGLVLTAGWIYLLMRVIKDGFRSVGWMILLFALLVLTFNAFCGFSYPYNF